jgi:hypothetical protein
LKIARLAHQAVFPFRLREVLEVFRLLAFLDEMGIPTRHIKLRVGCDPEFAFHLCRVGRAFRQRHGGKELLLADLRHVRQRPTEHIPEHPAAARFGDDAGKQLVGRGVDMIYAQAGKSLRERRQNHLRRSGGES